MMDSLRVQEPRNGELYYNLSRLFARYCGRRAEVLEKTQQLLEMAISMQPENSAFHAEFAYQKTL